MEPNELSGFVGDEPEADAYETEPEGDDGQDDSTVQARPSQEDWLRQAH